jgi:hypothetical protein
MKEHGILFQGPLVRALRAGTKTQTRRLVKLREFQPSDTKGYDWTWRDRRGLWQDVATARLLEQHCPYGKPGDRLWVRETWSQCARSVYPCPPCWYRADYGKYDDPALEQRDHDLGCTGNQANCFACVAEREGKFVWRPSIFMPRWASRITLEVTEVRVQRLQDISEDDAKAEGVSPPSYAETWLCIPRGTGGPYEMFVEPDAEQRAELEHVKHQPARPMWSAQAEFRLLWNKINGERASWESNPWVWCVSFRRLETA